jgi:predicted site-specific integrase-resolvase
MTEPIAIITPIDAAKQLGMSVHTLKTLMQRGKIEHLRPSPRKWFFTQDQINTFLLQSKKRGA